MKARLALLAAPLALGSCGGRQSVFEAAGPGARDVAILTTVMFAGGAVILMLVVVLTAGAALGPARLRAVLVNSRTVVGAGIVFPIVLLTALLAYGVLATWRSVGAVGSEALQVDIVGEQFWWRVAYLDEAGAVAFETANELVIPVGRQVELTLRSADVIHSFWAPALAGKLDMIPGRTNVLRLVADRPGIYRGQCAEFCGEQHARMALDVIVADPADFAAWLATQRDAAAAPQLPEPVAGAALFLAIGCSGCHTIRGTAATGGLGPDLTHVGSRRTIAAGTLPNNAGTLAGWIASAQHIKPGSRMPSFDTLTGRELRALAAYLAGLQ